MRVILKNKENVKSAERLTYITVPAISPDTGKKILVDFDYFNEVVCWSIVSGFEPVATGKKMRFIWPLDNPVITGKFVSNRNHRGIDLRAEIGTIVKAVADGKVITSGETGLRGKFIYLDHEDADRSQSVYEHLETSYVVSGQTVAQGQTIALSGNSGRKKNGDPYDPHLHFELLMGVPTTERHQVPGSEPPYTWPDNNGKATGYHVNPADYLGK